MLGYTWGGSGAFFPRAQMRRRSPEDRAFDYPRHLAATGGLDWEDFITPNPGATPILGRAQAALHEQVLDRLRRDGVQDFVGTGMGASPVLERAQEYLSAERAAAMGGGSLPTGMGATPILERAQLSLNPEALNTAIGNAPKIQSALTSEVEPPLVIRSGGATLPDPWLDSATVPRPAAPASGAGGSGRYLGADMVYDQGTGEGATPLGARNMSDGGPGTSSAKGQAAIDRTTARRGVGANVDAALGAFDLGIGEMARGGLRRAGAAARANGMKNLGNALFRAGGVARFGAPVAALGGSLLPAAMGAMEGFGEAGTGGALIQGGTAAAGTAAGAAIGTAILPGVGTVIGAGLGGMLASPVGKGLTGLAQGAVEKAQMGDTGPMGSIGRMLDPLIDTPFENEQKAILQQMNSPAMLAIKEQERTREAKARADMAYQALMQSYVR